MDQLTLLGTLYTFSGLLFIVLLAAARGAQLVNVRLFLWSLGAALFALAIPALVGQAYMGLFWSLEGLLLVYFGARLGMVTVRKEGYVLLAVAAGKLMLNSWEIITQWGETCWHFGLLNLSLVAILCLAVWRLGRSYQDRAEPWEVNLIGLAKELAPILLSLSLFVMGWHTFDAYMYTGLLLLSVGLLVWSAQFKTQYSALAGLAWLGIATYGLTQAFFEAGTLHLLQWPLYGQVLVVSLLVALWGALSGFQYWRLQNRPGAAVARLLREAFYVLIPFVVLASWPAAWFEYFITELAVSSLLAYGLCRLHPASSLRITFYVLLFLGLVGAWVTASFASGTLANLVVLAVLFVGEGGYSYKRYLSSEFHSLLNLSPVLVSLQLGFLTGQVVFPPTDLLGQYIIVSLWFAWVWCLLGLILARRWPIVRKTMGGNLLTLWLMVGATALATLVMVMLSKAAPYQWQIWVGTLATLILGGLAQRVPEFWEGPKGKRRANQFMLGYHLWWVPIFHIWNGVTPIDLLPWWALLLALQAIVLVFAALKRRSLLLNRASILFFLMAMAKVVLWDIRNLEMVAKIAVLIGLGLLLLGGAFLFVRLKSRFQSIEEEDSLPEEATEES